MTHWHSLEDTSQKYQETTTKCTSSANISNYTPQVGDVIEFDKCYDHTQGIVFSGSGNGQLGVVHCDDSWTTLSYIGHVVKIGRCEEITPLTDITQAYEIAKKYFSTPVFKTGDTVEVIGSGDCGHPVGSIGVVADDEAQNSLKVIVNGKIFFHNAKNLKPA